jgi:hypothetical protein
VRATHRLLRRRRDAADLRALKRRTLAFVLWAVFLLAVYAAWRWWLR